MCVGGEEGKQQHDPLDHTATGIGRVFSTNKPLEVPIFSSFKHVWRHRVLCRRLPRPPGQDFGLDW